MRLYERLSNTVGLGEKKVLLRDLLKVCPPGGNLIFRLRLSKLGQEEQLRGGETRRNTISMNRHEMLPDREQREQSWNS